MPIPSLFLAEDDSVRGCRFVTEALPTPWCRPGLRSDLPEMSDPRSTLRSMAEIVQLGAWRERKQAEGSAPEVERLERAIARLDGILERVTGQTPAADPRLE